MAGLVNRVLLLDAQSAVRCYQHETQVIRSEVNVLSEQLTQSHQVRSEGVFKHETQVIRSEVKGVIRTKHKSSGQK